MKESEHVVSLKKTFDTTTAPEEELFKRFQDSYRRLKNSLSTIHIQSHIKTEVADIIKQSVLDNWAFLLDEFSCVASNNLDAKGKINAFLSDLENVAVINEEVANELSNDRPLNLINSLNKFLNPERLPKCFKLINRSAHKINFAKFCTEKKTNKIKAKEMLNDVIANDVHFETIAHYYMVHLLIRTENPRNRHECPQVYEHALKARKGLIAMTECQSEMNCSISYITENYRDQCKKNFLAVNEYEAQKKGIIELINIYVSYLDDILGKKIY